MSEILMTWLNTEVDLSKKIKNIEEDFSNGYLLGELLYKFNQLTNFKEYKNKDDRDSKLKNFDLLEHVFSNMQIKFTSKTAQDIMMKKKGVVLKLLYQIKMKLEKKGVNIDALTMKNSSKINELYYSMRFTQKIDSYDRLSHSLYHQRLQNNTKAQNEVDMEKKLSRYTNFKQQRDVEIDEDKKRDEKNFQEKREKNIQELKSKAQRMHAFNQTFEQEGIEKWKQNMLKKKEAEKKELDFQLREAEKYQNHVNNIIYNSKKETIEKIDNFEKNLHKLQSDALLINAEDKIKENFKGLALANCDQAIQKIYNKIIQDQNAKRERDRRRRKIIVDQSKAQLEIENKNREEQLTLKLFKMSNQEKQLHYDTYRVDQNKKIIIENRKLREELYEEKKRSDIVFNQKNQREFLNFHKENFYRELNKEELRRKELEIALKQKKRSNNTDFSKDIVKLIIDISEEAYIYQQNNDSENIDQRMWREWMQLFVNDRSVFEEDNKLIDPNSDNDVLLDECEFLDYLYFKGQWKTELIPEISYTQINLIELFQDQSSQTTTEANTKNNPKQAKLTPNVKEKETSDFKEDDPENLVIHKEPYKNNYLGDLVDMIIDLKYNEDDKVEEKKNLFSYIPLKLCLIGHSFSGKKTQAKILSENFPFKIYYFDDLIRKSLDILERLEKPIEIANFSHTLSSTKKNQIEQIQKERQDEELKCSEIKKIAINIREKLINGDPISDEIYVDLLVENIRLDFPFKSDAQIYEEVMNKYKRQKEIQYELDKIKFELESNEVSMNKKVKNKHNEEQMLNQELMKISLDSLTGFVVVDFPNTYNQAKLLEKTLTGYIPELEKPLSQCQIFKENASLILDKSKKVEKSKELIQSGMDVIFHLDVPSQECIRRAFGRRIDSETNIIYHLEDNLPSTEEGRVCERLKELDEPYDSQSNLVCRHLAFDNAIQLINEFYEPFGIHDSLFKLFNVINGHKPKDYVTQDLIEVINNFIKIIDKKESSLVENLQNEELRKLLMTPQSNNGTVNNITNLVDKTELKNNISTSNIAISQKQSDDIPLYEKLKKTFPIELRDVLIKLWFKIYENYIKESKRIFDFLRKQRESISNNYNKIQQKFINFLKRPNKKQTLLLEYQLKYNKFLDDYPDLRDDDHVKEEHHQALDDLNDKIYEIIETRKNEAIDERKKIIGSGYIENEMEKLYSNLERLFQAEIDKYTGSMQLIRDYYYTLNGKVLYELPVTTIDIIKDEIDTVPLESENDPNQFPRIEKLYRSSLRVQFQYDEIINKAEKEKLAQAQAVANNDKKNIKQDKNKKTEPVILLEEKKEPAKYDDEMKLALKYEKSKYRHRITLLKYWAINTLKNLRKFVNTVYNKLEDWIILSFKAENESLNQLLRIVRDNIEKEEKIKYELEMDIFDTIINMDIQNYVEPPNKPLPGKEVIDHKKFNLVQLKIIFDELKTYEFKQNYIKSSTFIEIYIKKHLISKIDNDVYNGIPQSLRDLSFHNFYKFVKHMDYENKDILNVKFVCTILAILHSKVCSSVHERSLRSEAEKHLKNGKIEKDSFFTIPMWFDNDEDSITLYNHENFKRVEKLKEILFEVNKDNSGLVDFEEILSYFTLRNVAINLEQHITNSYYDVLFF